VPGRYRLAFDLGTGGFFEAATLDVRIEDASRSHHVPLLLAPYGLTSYRGS
jgi:5-hydroxyisourate hydrolase